MSDNVTAETKTSNPSPRRVYRPCKYCGDPCFARELWKHQAGCAKNPRNIPHEPAPTKAAPTKGHGKPVTCRWCGAELLQMFLRSHFLACQKAPQVNDGEKICTCCQEPKPMDEFPRHAREQDGRNNQCKRCTQTRSNEWYKDPLNQERRKYHLRLKFYGIDRETYDQLLASQKGLCAICGQPPSGGPKNSLLHVDHDHATGKARGLLCSYCNPGLGAFRDDVGLMEKAIAYLRLHQPDVAQ